MKIIFIVYRTNNYRFFTSLIQEGLKRGYNIECWHIYGRQGNFGIKKYTFPYLKYMPKIQFGNNAPKGKIIAGDKGLNEELLLREGIDVVISIHPPHYYLSEENLKGLPFLWCTIFSSIDSYIELTKIPQEKLKYKFTDIFFVPSTVFVKKGRGYLKRFFPNRFYLLDERQRRISIPGTIEFDRFKNVNKEEVRKKYKIPEDKAIFLYLPFPYWNNSDWENAFSGILINTKRTKDGSFIHGKKSNVFDNLIFKIKCLRKIFKDRLALKYFLKGLNEAKVFMAVRDFCDKNNLYLVVKPRLKYPVAEIIKCKADLVVWDDEKQQNPAVLNELLTLARMSFAFFSSSVLASAFAGVYHLNVVLPDGYFNYNFAEKFWYSIEEESSYNFSGVCESWSIEEIISKLSKTPLEHFIVNPSCRSEYIKNYIGFDDYLSSARFFNIVEKNLINKDGVRKQ